MLAKVSNCEPSGARQTPTFSNPADPQEKASFSNPPGSGLGRQMPTFVDMPAASAPAVLGPCRPSCVTGSRWRSGGRCPVNKRG